MQLSYSLRLICLVTVSIGLLLMALELLLRVSAPLVLRLLESLSLRHQERAVYIVRLTPFALSVCLTTCLCIPGYLSTESNHAPESVGKLFILLTAGIALWFAGTAVRGLRIAERTLRFARACRREGRRVVHRTGRVPVLSIPGSIHAIALVGLIQSFVLLPEDLVKPVEEHGLDPLALEVVLDHEQAHADQHDNWKLLSLHCLPRLNLGRGGAGTWMQLWMRLAELAADEDAVRGSRARALSLAETLVLFARRAGAPSAAIVCTTLVFEEAGLALRVERLLRQVTNSAPPAHRSVTMAIGSAGLGIVLAMALLAALLATQLHNLPEHLLHLG